MIRFPLQTKQINVTQFIFTTNKFKKWVGSYHKKEHLTKRTNENDEVTKTDLPWTVHTDNENNVMLQEQIQSWFYMQLVLNWIESVLHFANKLQIFCFEWTPYMGSDYCVLISQKKYDKKV